MHDYEILFDRSSDSMCEVDATGRIQRINASCEALLGLKSMPSSLADSFDDEGRTRLLAKLDSLAANSPTAEFVGFQPEQGRWTSWQLTQLTPKRNVAVGRDVTEHHETARTLAEKSSFLQSIIDAEPECVKLVGADGQLLDMNQAGLTMVAAPSPEAVLGACVYDLMAPEDRERFIAFNDQVCSGTGGELSFDIIALDGTRRSMETTAVPLADPAGNEDEDALIHLAITRDVTQRRMLEGQLRQAQKIKAIGQLAGGVAHDFNNLLTAIIGPAELAIASLGEDHPVTEDLQEIKATGERAARLTQKLLAFARQQVVQLTTLSLVELMGSLREMLERLLGESLQLEIEIDPDTRSVLADRGSLEQVILNLVVNARDALCDDTQCDEGKIRIRIGNETLTEDHATSLGCKGGSYVVFEVSDEGVGISPETLPLIFDPFFTTKAQGTGLGLSTCYGIVKQSNGAIDVRSTVSKGTLISVYLPEAPKQEPTPEVDAPLPRRGGETILVAEDEALVRSTIVRMLRSAGYDVHEAANGQEALERARELPHLDLLVSDMAMPGMGGRELASLLLKSSGPGSASARSGSALKVLFLTGYLRPPASPPNDASRNAPVLHKPFTNQELCQAVAQALQGNDAATRAA